MAATADLGRFQARRRKVLAVLIAVIFLVLLFVASAGSDATHELVEKAGAVLILIAILGRTWCTLYIGGRKSAEIVTGGPYSMTRNPLYVFSAIGAAGIGAMTGSVVVASLFAVFTWLAFLTVIFVEERFLDRNFGEPYRAYMKRVPRFFPKPWLFQESESLTIRPQLIYRTFADGLVFILAYPFFELVEYFQDIGTLPVVLRLY
ncbi:methyltransferase family protein [Mesorhizobium sp. ASY16-5R]|uniref:methyltransferase family protein n=1 Tax=Mesorhizobium sp. ASY16-5R TaxID=3445772 RepID=UPI003FA0F909